MAENPFAKSVHGKESLSIERREKRQAFRKAEVHGKEALSVRKRKRHSGKKASKKMENKPLNADFGQKLFKSPCYNIYWVVVIYYPTNWR